MTPQRPSRNRPDARRRGVTLVEMLVSVALLVLMMTVIVQVFAAATTAVSGARVYQELDGSLRQLDSTVRQDLSNITANLTPPLNPKDNLGYFEYAENSFADSQGEDCDDTLRFTVKAPEGQVFTGRFYQPVPPMTAPMTGAQNLVYYKSQPITITSQFAEIIYFLRAGNLYRRVLLVAPDRQSQVIQYTGPTSSPTPFTPGIFNSDAALSSTAVPPPRLDVGFQGVHDLSVRPNSTLNTSSGGGGSGAFTITILNTLGDLTNRENRYASPRFCNDFYTTGGAAAGDGVADDFDGPSGTGNGVPDYYPTLYPNVFSITNPPLTNEAAAPGRAYNYATMPFPFIFPGAYSAPHQFSAANGLGWIHSPDANNPQNSLFSLGVLNHNPVDIGDSLPTPLTTKPPLTAWTWGISSASSGYGVSPTWWGFPTWRETMSPNWNDATAQLAVGGVKLSPFGLNPLDPSVYSPPAFPAGGLLPPMTNQVYLGGTNTPFRPTTEPFTDGAGSAFFAVTSRTGFPADALWRQLWEDDLIMTGVRSFDVKAYDNAYAGYVDLGWGDDLRLYQPYRTGTVLNGVLPPYLGLPAMGAIGTNIVWPPAPPVSDGTWPPPYVAGSSVYNLINQTYAHEGRMPPMVADGRVDPQNPTRINSAGNVVAANLGDDSGGVIRLRRVWDTWSTDYTRTPANGFDPSTSGPTVGRTVGPPFTNPVYPSYPPPYPLPLRGIQIQIRVVDPRNERVKILTIKQDFSDKL